MSKFVYVLVLCLLFTACEKKENQIQNEESLSTPSINIKKGDGNTLKDELWVSFDIYGNISILAQTTNKIQPQKHLVLWR